MGIDVPPKFSYKYSHKIFIDMPDSTSALVVGVNGRGSKKLSSRNQLAHNDSFSTPVFHLQFYPEHLSTMPISKPTSPCGGCKEPVGPIHRCPTCACHMHPFCGRPVGEEGFGQPVMCPGCDNKAKDPPDTSLESASPIVASFHIQARQQNRPNISQEMGTTIDLSESDSDSDQEASNLAPHLPTQLGTRHTQAVSTVANRRKVLRWMEKHEKLHGDEGMFAKAVDKFPTIFNSATRSANLAKSIYWWRKRNLILHSERGTVAVSARRRGGRRRVGLKVIGGRGRPRSAWVEWIYPLLLDEFDRLRKLGVKFDPALLLQLAKQLLRDSVEPYNERSVDGKGALIIDKITPRWVQCFMEAHQIVLRTQTGKKQLSPAKLLHIEKEVAFHLGEVQRGFANGSLNENAIENIDETHFIVDFDNGKTLGFSGETSIKYADVVSGGEGMTMVVRISGGPSARVHPPLMIFMNAAGNYPIHGVPDKTPGVCYRSSKKGWMTQKLFREYLKEKRAIRADPHGRKKTIYLDNCSGHLEANECEAELDGINSTLKFFPPNATDLCQPADSFVIAKIKDAWKKKWNEKKMKLIVDNCWQNKVRKDGSWSGKIQNPGKKFFLELAADAVKAVNLQKDKNGMSYARKAMIRCGLSLGIDGTWSVTQLYPHLQEIVKKHRSHFDGEPVDVVASG